MKKFSLIAIFCAVLSLGYAQIDYGFRLGPNVSMVLGSDRNFFDTKDAAGNIIGTQQKLGYNAGFYARMPINENFYFRPEIGVSAKGAANKKAVYQFVDAKFNRYDFTYIDLPLLLQIGNAEEGLHLFVGPQVSYLLQARRRLENEYTDIEKIIGKKPSSLAIGAVLGLGYEMPSGLAFGLRAEYTVTPIAPDVKINILALQATLGFNISSIDMYRKTHRNR